MFSLTFFLFNHFGAHKFLKAVAIAVAVAAAAVAAAVVTGLKGSGCSPRIRPAL